MTNVTQASRQQSPARGLAYQATLPDHIAAFDQAVKPLAQKAAQCEAALAELALVKRLKGEVETSNDRLNSELLKSQRREKEFEQRFHAVLREHQVTLKEMWAYAEVCQRQAEEARHALQEAVKTSCEGKPVFLFKCPQCVAQRGKRPIHEFPVRVAKSGNLCFGPYCLACEEERKRKSRHALRRRASVRAMASEILGKAPPPLVAALADGLEGGGSCPND